MAAWTTTRLLLNVIIATIVTTMATAQTNCKTMTTFNVGLINSVGIQNVRLPRIIDALKQAEGDFICLQEIWLEKDMSAILDGVQSVFPHHWSKLHAAQNYLREPADRFTKMKETPCRLRDTVRLANEVYPCGQKYGCFNLTGVEQNLCLLRGCSDVFKCGTIKESCIACLFFKAPLSFEQSLRECVIPLKVHNRVNNPGLLVLSKQRLNRVSFTPYFPGYRTAVQRGYIEAELDDGKLTACTHLTAGFPIYLEYDLPFTSYLEQQQEEIRVLGKAFAGKKHILMGDLNTGPTIPDQTGERLLVGEYPQNYDLLKSFGYRAPYMEQDGRCTFCKVNPLTQGYSNNVIDQVLVNPRGSFSTPNSKRVFDTIDPLLSDHYGTQTQVCDP